MSEPKLPAPEPTDVASRYQIVKKLGAGAFGTVYKARDRVLGRMVAIKTIRMDGLAAAGATLQELLERFEREAQVSAQLRHPNIVTIHDIGKDGEVSYLAMEFIDGVGLERIIAAEKRLGPARAASIAAQVADALDFAHRNGVVHRDIKPANIMIEDGDRVKVTDFGIAKVIDSGEHLTMTGSLLGTPSYMSPEQARGVAIDGRSDLFAVGCILYEMLSGQKAFRGDSITGLIFKIITEEPTPLRQLAPDAPDELARIVNKALAKAPEARYQTGRELKDDLQRLLQPGVVPTLRAGESPTSPAGAALGPDAATLHAPLTSPGAPPTRVSPSRGAPTTVSPPAPPPPATATRAAGAQAPRPAAQPARKGVGVAVIVVVLAFGALMLAAAAVGGWYFFLRQPATDGGGQVAGGGAGLEAGGPATPGPAATGGDASAAGAAEPAGGAPGDDGTRVADAGTTSAGGAPGPTGTTGSTTGGSAARAAGDRAPDAGPLSGGASQRREAGLPPDVASEGGGIGPGVEDDAMSGREAGRRASEAYRSPQRGYWDPGPSRYGTRRPLRERPRVPRDLTLAERPGAGVLLQIRDAEERFNRQRQRYGSLAELRESGALRLNAPAAVREFVQHNYEFTVTATPEGYEARATPRRAGLRPLKVDDSGYVQVADD